MAVYETSRPGVNVALVSVVMAGLTCAHWLLNAQHLTEHQRTIRLEYTHRTNRTHWASSFSDVSVVQNGLLRGALTGYYDRDCRRASCELFTHSSYKKL